MRCIFLGTPEFAIPAADAVLRASTGELVGIITQPDRPVGRSRVPTPPPLATWATEHRIALFQPETTDDLRRVIIERNLDIGIVVAYGRIIPQDVLALPRLGFVNLHPSLLPRWRGPSPIAAAIATGDTETGVTLMLLDAEVDHGPIIAQERIPLSPSATRSPLERELADLGARLLTRILPEYLAGRITPQPQEHTAATYSTLLTRDDGRIDWREPAAVIERKVRAYEGWPGTWCILPNGKRLKVLQATLDGNAIESPGAVLQNGTFTVSCGDHRALLLDRVEPEGKPPMDGRAFLRGHPDITRVA